MISGILQSAEPKMPDYGIHCRAIVFEDSGTLPNRTDRTNRTNRTSSTDCIDLRIIPIGPIGRIGPIGPISPIHYPLLVKRVHNAIALGFIVADLPSAD